jgi:hypothetical protein
MFPPINWDSKPEGESSSEESMYGTANNTKKTKIK